MGKYSQRGLYDPEIVAQHGGRYEDDDYTQAIIDTREQDPLQMMVPYTDHHAQMPSRYEFDDTADEILDAKLHNLPRKRSKKACLVIWAGILLIIVSLTAVVAVVTSKRLHQLASSEALTDDLTDTEISQLLGALCSPESISRLSGYNNCQESCLDAECCFTPGAKCVDVPEDEFCIVFADCAVLLSAPIPEGEAVDDLIWNDDVENQIDDLYEDDDADDDGGMDDDAANDDDADDDAADDDAADDDAADDDDADDDGADDDAADDDAADDDAVDDDAADDDAGDDDDADDDAADDDDADDDDADDDAADDDAADDDDDADDDAADDDGDDWLVDDDDANDVGINWST